GARAMAEYDPSALHRRRRFLRQTACELGTIALAELLRREGRTADTAPGPGPLAPRPPHYAARAKSVIFLFMAGGPRHLGLYGHPAMGAWVTYGLGSAAQELPGFVVLLSNSGKGVDAGTALWGNGFLPSAYRGVTLRTLGGDPVLHLANPAGVSAATQRARLD